VPIIEAMATATNSVMARFIEPKKRISNVVTERGRKEESTEADINNT
jgi:hypothetical protein